MTGLLHLSGRFSTDGARRTAIVWNTTELAVVIVTLLLASLQSGVLPGLGHAQSPRTILPGAQPSRLITSAGPAASMATPSKRWGAQVTTDPSEGDTLLFSGSNGRIAQNGVAYGDTWTYESGIWIDITPSSCTNTSCPEARTYGAMSYYDQSGQQYVVMFGGQYVGTSGVFLGDTWIFNGSWHNVTPSPVIPYVNSPPPLHYTSMAWDALDGYDVLYGGCTRIGCSLSSIISNQTWGFEGLEDGVADWVNLTTPVHPPRLYSPGLTFDAADGYLLLFGGVTVQTNTLIYQNQTWSYTAANGWVNRTALFENASNTPATRVWTMMAYYPTDAYTVLFGGQESQNKTKNPTLDDSWIYSDGAWTNIYSMLTTSPPARFGGAMAFDPSDDALLLFGGLSGTPVNSPLLDDTWWFSGTPGTWTNHTPLPPEYPVKFTETGLPASSPWWLNVTNSQSNQSFNSTKTTISFSEADGTYSYSASAQGYANQSGHLTVSGSAGASVTIRFHVSASGSSGLTVLDYVIIGAVAVWVVIGVAVVLIRRRGKVPPKTAAPSSHPEDGPAKPSQPSPSPGSPPSSSVDSGSVAETRDESGQPGNRELGS